MGINIADNFAYNGKKPMDNRTEYATLSTMKSVVDANINEGCLAYNKEDGKYYKFLSTNTVDVTTGKWREFSTGGGTYNDFTGATASTAGAHGLVPAPSAGDEGKVLFGNGLWGALPSVDLSVLSNEENILSTTEKVVGQDADGYLIYQRTIRDTVPTVSSGHDADKLFDLSSANIREMKKLWGSAKNSTSTTPLISTYLGITNISSLIVGMIFYNYSNSKLYLRNNNFPELGGASAEINIQYTKTTDSPLPAGVKFAGVTSSGEVIYEKTVETTSPSSANTWTVIADLGVNCVICEAVGTIYPGSGAIGARSINFMGAIAYSMNYSKNGEFALFVNEGGYTNKPVIAKIRYTLAS